MMRKFLVASLVVCVVGSGFVEACRRGHRASSCSVPSTCVTCVTDGSGSTEGSITAEERQLFLKAIEEVKAWGDPAKDFVADIEVFLNGNYAKQKEWLDANTPDILPEEQKAFEKAVSLLGTEPEKAAYLDTWAALSNAGKRYFMAFKQISAEEISWFRNYSGAREVATAQNKPLAVVFGAGQNGRNQVLKSTPTGRKAVKTLAENYVCVYIDVNTPAGRVLRGSFGVANTGVVLSDQTVQLQAFSHQGSLKTNQLAPYVQKYADPLTVVDGTETVNSPRNLTRLASAPDLFFGPVVGVSFQSVK